MNKEPLLFSFAWFSFISTEFTHRKFQERGHTSKQLEHEGLPVYNVELVAGKFDGLTQLGIAFIIRVHLREKATYSENA